jgi:hypothetical protein
MPTPFDTVALVRALKPTTAETKVMADTATELKRLNALVESTRPTNPTAAREKRNAAHAALVKNPTAGTVESYVAAVAYSEHPDRLHQHATEVLNELSDKAAAALDPVATRLHEAALAAVQDAQQFGLDQVNSIEDIEERATGLLDFARAHKDAIAEIENGGASIGTPRGSLNWLAGLGFMSDPYAAP